MKFNLLNDFDKNFISHIVLHDIDIAKIVAETPDWKEDRSTVAKITVNDAEIPFETVEAYFQDLYERLQKAADEKYADLEKEVQRRLEERVKAEVKPLLEKMQEIAQALESAEDFIKPYWEK